MNYTHCIKLSIGSNLTILIALSWVTAQDFYSRRKINCLWLLLCGICIRKPYFMRNVYVSQVEENGV